LFKQSQIVLVDTNVLIEAHRTGCLASLANYFSLHTVETVVTETQTGHQNRSPEETIDLVKLKSQLKHIEVITQAQRAAFYLAYPTVALDPGELDLIIYAGSFSKNTEVWFLNSPDMAAVRHAYTRNWLDRLVSLEAMTSHISARLSGQLPQNYTERWLRERKLNLLLGKL
jgi:hypothetical protein